MLFRAFGVVLDFLVFLGEGSSSSHSKKEEFKLPYTRNQTQLTPYCLLINSFVIWKPLQTTYYQNILQVHNPETLAKNWPVSYLGLMTYNNQLQNKIQGLISFFKTGQLYNFGIRRMSGYGCDHMTKASSLSLNLFVNGARALEMVKQPKLCK